MTELTERQQLILRKVIERFNQSGDPVSSKVLAEDAELGCGPSTIRSELSILEKFGLLAHPHTSAGRVPTDRGYRYFVDRFSSEYLVPARGTRTAAELHELRHELGSVMQQTTESLARLTDLVAIVTAPRQQLETIRHVEVLLLQPDVLMVVVITSTGGVTKRVLSFSSELDPGLITWLAGYLNEQLVGVGIGTRMLVKKLLRNGELGARELQILEQVLPVFTELEPAPNESLFIEGTARLLAHKQVGSSGQLAELIELFERRMKLLGLLNSMLETGEGIYVKIGSENELPELRSLTIVAAAYGLPYKQLGTVSVIGPTAMDYGTAISSVWAAARDLSSVASEIYV